MLAARDVVEGEGGSILHLAAAKGNTEVRGLYTYMCPCVCIKRGGVGWLDASIPTPTPAQNNTKTRSSTSSSPTGPAPSSSMLATARPTSWPRPARRVMPFDGRGGETRIGMFCVRPNI